MKLYGADACFILLDYVHARVIPELTEEGMFQAVPLELLAHTVRATLKPTILVEEIPLLLTSLGHIEHVRLIIMKKLQKMSQLNQRIRVARSKARADGALNDVEHNRTEDIPLTRKEDIFVEEAFARGPELRAAFRKSVAEFSLMVNFMLYASGSLTDGTRSMPGRHGALQITQS